MVKVAASHLEEFESLTQDAIERLIRKDIDHICSIFGIPVRNCPFYGAVYDNLLLTILRLVPSLMLLLFFFVT